MSMAFSLPNECFFEPNSVVTRICPAFSVLLRIQVTISHKNELLKILIFLMVFSMCLTNRFYKSSLIQDKPLSRSKVVNMFHDKWIANSPGNVGLKFPLFGSDFINMKHIITTTIVICASGLGWWLGSKLGIMAALVLSMIGVGLGMYFGRRLVDF